MRETAISLLKEKKKTLCNTRIHLWNPVEGSMTSCIEWERKRSGKRNSGKGSTEGNKAQWVGLVMEKKIMWEE